MKRTLIYWWTIILFLGGAFLLASCDDDDETTPVAESALTMLQKDWTSSGKAEQYALAIFANVDWIATVDSSWVTLGKTEGKGNDVITVGVPDNLSGETRKATLTVKAVGDEALMATFEIIQKAPLTDQVTIDLENCLKDTIEIPSTGGTLKVKVKANVDYECKLADWMKWDNGRLAAVDSTLENQLAISIEPNLEVAHRTNLEFKWKEEGVEKSRKVAILQEAIRFSLEMVDLIPVAGGAGKFVLHANEGDALAESLLSVNSLSCIDKEIVLPVSGLDLGNAHQLSVIREVANYNSYVLPFQVIAQFSLNGGNRTVTKVFEVQQAACPGITIEGDRWITLPIDSTKKTIDFKVNLPFEGAEWEAKMYTLKSVIGGQGVEEVPCSWASVAKTTDGIQVTWTKNEEHEEREATVKVYLKAAETNAAMVDFTQEKAPIVWNLVANDREGKANITSTSLRFEYTPSTYYCEFEMVEAANGMLTNDPTDKTKWYVYSPGANNEQAIDVPLEMSENTEPTDRVAKFKVTLYDREGGNKLGEKVFTYTQLGKVAAPPLQATISGSNVLPVEDSGAPLIINVTGGSGTVTWYYVSESGSESPASWLRIFGGGDRYQLFLYKDSVGKTPTGPCTIRIRDSSDNNNFTDITIQVN